MTAPNRRRFRFGLRTLLVVVTFGCIWLGWNLRYVREREAVLRGAHKVCNENAWTVEDNLPKAWRLLGAEPVWWVYLPRSVSDEELTRVQALFPETICVSDLHRAISREEPDELLLSTRPIEAIRAVIYHVNRFAAVALAMIVLTLVWLSRRRRGAMEIAASTTGLSNCKVSSAP